MLLQRNHDLGVNKAGRHHDRTLTTTGDSEPNMVGVHHILGHHYIPLVKTRTEPDETFNPLPALHIPQVTVVLRKRLYLLRL